MTPSLQFAVDRRQAPTPHVVCPRSSSVEPSQSLSSPSQVSGAEVPGTHPRGTPPMQFSDVRRHSPRPQSVLPNPSSVAPSQSSSAPLHTSTDGPTSPTQSPQAAPTQSCSPSVQPPTPRKAGSPVQQDCRSPSRHPHGGLSSVLPSQSSSSPFPHSSVRGRPGSQTSGDPATQLSTVRSHEPTPHVDEPISSSMRPSQSLSAPSHTSAAGLHPSSMVPPSCAPSFPASCPASRTAGTQTPSTQDAATAQSLSNRHASNPESPPSRVTHRLASQ